MVNSTECTVTSIQKRDTSVDYGVLDASKNNRTPSLSAEKIFEVKYSECYGDHYDIEELKNLAIFDILAYEILTEKQIKEIKKNMQKLNDLSFEEIDTRRTDAIVKNKTYTEPEYKIVSYYFLRNNKLNVIYRYKNENDAFIMKLNNSIEDSINEYNEKINKFKERNIQNAGVPKDWIMRVILLKQILKIENHNK